jgi:hypothetical protein
MPELRRSLRPDQFSRPHADKGDPSSREQISTFMGNSVNGGSLPQGQVLPARERPPIIFDGSKFTAPNRQPLQYSWDFGRQHDIQWRDAHTRLQLGRDFHSLIGPY